MANSEKIKITRVNYYDGQRVTESDLDNDQNYFRSLISNLVLDFHSSGVLKKELKKRFLFNLSKIGTYGDNPRKSTVDVGKYDGKYINIDRQPSDSVYGNRLVVKLDGSTSRGRESTKVLIIGRVFNSLEEEDEIKYEVLTLKRGEEKLTKFYYNFVFGIILNNYSGGIGKNNFETGIKHKENKTTDSTILIWEAESLSVYPDIINAEQIQSPNFDLMFFASSSNDKTIKDEISECLTGSVGVEQTFLDFEYKEEISFAKDGNINIKYGQKFLSNCDNIQKINLYLSVDEDTSLSDPYDWTGNLVFSLYELSTEISCATSVTPETLLGYDPELTPIIQVSYDIDDLKSSGVKLTSTPTMVSINLSSTNIAVPSSELIKKDKYYAFEIKRTGLNNKGTIKLFKGYDIPTRKESLGVPLDPIEKFGNQQTRFFQFDPTTNKYLDDKEGSLWFQVESSAVQITDGVCYTTSGLFVMVPKNISYIGQNLISYYERNISLPFVDGQKNYLILEQLQNFEDADIHPRTGNFVYTRIQDIPGFKFVKADYFVGLNVEDYPLIMASIADKNPRSSVSLERVFDSAGLYDTDYFYVLNPSESFQQEKLIGRSFIPDTKCQCENIYKIIDVECEDVLYGDLDKDGKITSADVEEVLSLSGNTINGIDTERRLFGGEFSIVDFELSDVNDDGSIDGFDIELVEDASEGKNNFLTPRVLRYFKIHVESLVEPEQNPTVFLDSSATGETTTDSNLISFTVANEEQALAIRVGDTLTIPSGDDAGDYSILTKSVGADKLSVTVTVSQQNASVSFSGSSGVTVKIVSKSSTNVLADNLDLIKTSFSDKSYLIYQDNGVFIESNFDVCDLKRFIEFSYIDFPDESCLCEVVGCDLVLCDTKSQNEKYLPGNILVAGNILDEEGNTHKLDYEYASIKVPLPPGSLEDCKLDLYNNFIKASDSSCITAAGTPALKYSDGTYVGCEDNGSDTDLTKNRVKISCGICSVHVDALVDGYSARTQEVTDAVNISEVIGENFNDESYSSFSSWVEYFANPAASFGSILTPSGTIEPATFSFTTAAVSGNKKFILNKPSSSSNISGNFVIDFVCLRTNWTEDDLGTGNVKFAFEGEIENYDSGVLTSTSNFSVGIRKVGPNKREVFFSGTITSPAGATLYTFDFGERLDDVLGDNITFRVKRSGNVITTYYHISKKIIKELNQFERIGENLTSHLGIGDLNYNFSIGQDNMPNGGKSYAIKVTDFISRSSFVSFEDDATLLLASDSSTNRVDRVQFNFPLNLSQRTNIIRADLVLTSLTTATVTDTYYVIPLEVLDARTIQTTENYPETTNESLFTEFIPNNLVQNQQFTVDISSIIISYLKNTAHISGFFKALIIEPSAGSNSSFEISSDIKLNITYGEVTSGAIFKIGMDLDAKTGIASFKTKNILYDKLIRENRTVIGFGVHMKKAGFANQDVEVSLGQLQSLGIGTCYTAEQLPADNDCYFVTGNTSVGTFVDGPFPCVLKLNE